VIAGARQALAHEDLHILVVDDASPDGTGALAETLGAEVLHRPRKLGLGSAYVAGFTRALAHDPELVCQMDADGSHDPAALPHLVALAREGADLVLGSRYVPGGRLQNWPRRRELLSRWGNRYVRAALGIPLRDATGGYRAFRAEVLRALPLAEIASQGYCFQVELAWRSVLAGFRVREVPITFTERAAGESKMSGSIVREALWRVTRWGVGRLCGNSGRP
jgi:dolichol-phosphate mannosyltransferase